MTRMRRHGPVLAAVAAGAAVGSEARYALGLLQAGPPAWPWATFVENVSGSLLIGVLMVIVLELTAPHRLLRPFLGVGVLGGYTTFSTYTVDIQHMLLDGRHATALGYLVATPLAALVAVWLASTFTHAWLRRRRAS